MKDIHIRVANHQASFVRKLLKQFDFVEIKEEVDAKEEILANLRQAFKDGNLAKQGKLKTRPVREFLDKV